MASRYHSEEIQHDAHVITCRELRTVFLYEKKPGHRITVQLSRGVPDGLWLWALERIVEMKRAELRGEWKND